MLTYCAPRKVPARLVRLFTLVMLLAILANSALAQVLTLDSTQYRHDLYDEMAIVEIEGFDINDPRDRARGLEAANRPETPRGIRVKQGDWTVASILNETEQTQIFRFNFVHGNMTGIKLYEARNGTLNPIFEFQKGFIPISQRPTFDTQMGSAPIHLLPGERIDIWLYHEWSEWSEWIGLWVVSEQAYLYERKISWAGYALYFGSAMMLIAFFIVFAILLRSIPAAWYGLFFFGLLAVNALTTNFLQLFVYPEHTGLSLYLGRPLQLLVVVSHLMFVASFTSARDKYPAFFRVILGLIALGVVITVWESLHWSAALDMIANVYGMTFAIVGAYGAWLAVRNNQKGSTLFAVGVLILFVNIVIGTVIAAIDYDDSLAWLGTLMIVLQVIDGLVFAGAIVRQTFALRADRDRALRAELDASRARLRALEARAAAERDRESAERLATLHRQRLEATSHDLLQPLTSLQLALQDDTFGSEETKAKLATGLDYLNAVLGDTLDEVRAGDVHPSQTDQKPEPVPVQMVFDNLQRMFASEAQKKNLDLRFRASNAVVETDVVGLIRALSNLVSNALKYSSAGTVLVAARPHGDGIRIEVYDTGAGMDQETLERILKKGQRGAHDHAVQGSGIGLNIVFEWAREQELDFAARSEIGRGSVFSLSGFKQISSDN